MGRPRSEAIEEIKAAFHSGELRTALQVGGLSEAATEKIMSCVKFVCKIL